MTRALQQKPIRYINDTFEKRDGRVIERNGNLALVRDEQTGEESYRAPHEIED